MVDFFEWNMNREHYLSVPKNSCHDFIPGQLISEERWIDHNGQAFVRYYMEPTEEHPGFDETTPTTVDEFYRAKYYREFKD